MNAFELSWKRCFKVLGLFKTKIHFSKYIYLLHVVCLFVHYYMCCSGCSPALCLVDKMIRGPTFSKDIFKSGQAALEWLVKEGEVGREKTYKPGVGVLS